MPQTRDPALTIDDLGRALKQADPRARLVSSRLLRRIILHERKLGVFGLHRTHRKTLTVATRSALRVATTEELGIEPDDPASETLLLIECPDLGDFADPDPARSRGDLLVWGWRRLFHAVLHAEIGHRVGAGRLSAEEVRSRVAAIGPLVYGEIRSVLERDGWLLTPDDPISVYEEFVVVYLELRHFAGALLPTCFPAVDDPAAIDALIARDVDGRVIFANTRPAGAPDPGPREAPAESGACSEARLSTDEAVKRSEAAYRRLMARADRAAKAGNLARSILSRTRAARLAGPSRAGQARGKAEDELGRLAGRIREALGPEARAVAGWRPALVALVDLAACGTWTVEARLLSDLQNACEDHERDIFAVDLLGWVVSLGRRPLRRALPNQKLVRMSRHLRKASVRLLKARLSEAPRAAMGEMLRVAWKAADGRVRHRFRPLIARALNRAGLKPTNPPERASFGKMTEELLDLVVERNFLTMGDIRDAVSRGQVRSPDLSGFGEFRRGDRVLRANRRFRVSLDGIYHPAEVYLRLLQRASLLAFGTKIGRWLTISAALPFGGAFGALVTVQEMLELALKLVPKDAGQHPHEIHLVHGWSVVLLGCVLLALIRSPRFRRVVLGAIRAVGSLARRVFLDAPAWVLRLPTMRAILRSRAFDVSRRVAIEPLGLAAATFGLVYWIDRDRSAALGIAAAVCGTTALVLNTRIGREAEEHAADAILLGWRRVRVDLLPGMARFFLDLFGRVLEAVEKVLYAVAEWLRYRSGQGRLSFWSKAVLGAFWFFAAYLIRIYINLLIEPQVNPVKHFPTVTVAAKMILPIIGNLVHAIAAPLKLFGPVVANGVAWFTVFFLPGLAGFVVWEFKENWRLFEANRPTSLRPVPIGHHGETMRRLLRPGFHSGTIPKLFAKLRRAEADAMRTGDEQSARRVREAIHHVEGAIRHFVERDLLTLVVIGSGGEDVASLEGIDLATNRVRLRLASPAGDPGPSSQEPSDLRRVGRAERAPPISAGEGGARSARPTLRDGQGETDLIFAFEYCECKLSVHVIEEGWLAALPEGSRHAWCVALEGFAAMAGVDRFLGAPWGPIDSEGFAISGIRAATPVAWRSWVAFWSREAAGEISARSPEPEGAV